MRASNEVNNDLSRSKGWDRDTVLQGLTRADYGDILKSLQKKNKRAKANDENAISVSRERLPEKKRRVLKPTNHKKHIAVGDPKRPAPALRTFKVRTEPLM